MTVRIISAGETERSVLQASVITASALDPPEPVKVEQKPPENYEVC